jgi:hypothetical protein
MLICRLSIVSCENLLKFHFNDWVLSPQRALCDIQNVALSKVHAQLGLHSTVGEMTVFCARLKTDISAFSSGLQGHLRSCLTILDSSRRPLSKNVRHGLVRPRRPELEAEMSVFNLAQKTVISPTCTVHSQLFICHKRRELLSQKFLLCSF